MKRIVPYAIAGVFVLAVVLDKGPGGGYEVNRARVWHNYGLELARAGNFEAAKTMLEESRECGKPDTDLWIQSTIALAVVCEALGDFAEADYYFVSDEVKYSATANDARSQFTGAWRNLRKAIEKGA